MGVPWSEGGKDAHGLARCNANRVAEPSSDAGY